MKGRERAIRAAVIFLGVMVLPIMFLIGIRPDFAFDKHRFSKPIALEEDPHIQVVEYGLLKGSDKSYSDGKKGSGFEAIGLTYIGYQDGNSTKYRWAPHISTTTTYDWDLTVPGSKPTNIKATITLR